MSSKPGIPDGAFSRTRTDGCPLLISVLDDIAAASLGARLTGGWDSRVESSAHRDGCPSRTLQHLRIRCEYDTDKSMQECLRGGLERCQPSVVGELAALRP
jgi:hypothetical protein